MSTTNVMKNPSRDPLFIKCIQMDVTGEELFFTYIKRKEYLKTTYRCALNYKNDVCGINKMP
jgi:hypothetical protein